MKNKTLINLCSKLYRENKMTFEAWQAIDIAICDELEVCRRKNYIKGEVINSLDDLMKEKVVFFHDKTVNIAVVRNWQYAYLIAQVQNGRFFKAVKKGDKQ